MTPRGMSIQEAYRLYREGNIFVNRRYQRKLVWTEEEKIKLIDTILRNYPIPLILLAERPSQGNIKKFEILDGVQRFYAIFSFIENHYPIENKYFDINEFARAKQLSEQGVFLKADESLLRLEKEKCANFLDYQLAVTIFPAYSDEQVTEIFSRINSGGRQLSNQERRQAGIIGPFGDLVRKISAEIRGDASKEVLLLSEMPEISIEPPRSQEKYGLRLEEIFWFKQGILSGKDLRESEDEEMIADISASILLNEAFPRSKEKFDELYDKKSDLYKRVEVALISYSYERLYEEIKQTFSIIREVIEKHNEGSNSLRNIVNPGSHNPILTSFYAIFMAFFDLMVKQNKSPAEYREIMSSLKNLQKRMSISSHYATPGDRTKNINIVIGLIQKHFVHEEPSILGHGPSLAIDFENSIRRSRMETSRYEFKQGLLSLDEAHQFNEDLLGRLINTICGMANLGSKSEGYIFLGVADKESDADRIKALFKIDYLEVGEHFIVGIDREIKQLKWKPQQYVDRIISHIRDSELSEPLKTQVLGSIDTITYRNFTIIRIKVPSQPAASFVGKKTYQRKGSNTEEVTSALEIAALISLFKT